MDRRSKVATPKSFESDFAASIERPTWNHRAAPELVRILSVLGAALEKDAVAMIPVDDGSTGHGECRLFIYEDHIKEAEDLAALIAGWITLGGLAPRDICVLTRNRPADYTIALQAALKGRDIRRALRLSCKIYFPSPWLACC